MTEPQPFYDSEPEYNDSQESQHTRFLARAGQVGAMAIILAEVTPLNEWLRLAMTEGTEVVTSNMALTSATASASTFVIESGAAIATAGLLGTDGGQRATEWVSSKAAKFNIGKEGMRTATREDLLLAFGAGSAVSVFAKHVQDPERTITENIKFGVRNSAIIAPVVAPLGTATSYLVEQFGATNVNIGLVSAVGLALGAQRLKRRWQTRRQPKDTSNPETGTGI